jgi:hypothetical protein
MSCIRNKYGKTPCDKYDELKASCLNCEKYQSTDSKHEDRYGLGAICKDKKLFFSELLTLECGLNDEQKRSEA